VKPLPVPQLPPIQEARVDPVQKTRDPAVRTSVSAAW
jgi:hypothetical protein